MSVWDELVGQTPAVAVLSKAIAEPQTLTHAWLLTGPPGSGRSVAARAFAAALQCTSGGCGVCHDCTTTLAGTHENVTWVATEGLTLRVDETRPLVQLAHRAPSAGRWRVIVVEDADRLNGASGNVLLKAIEEPPARTIWVLCAPSPADVLVTIRSRCRNVNLRVPPVDAVVELLIRRDGVEPQAAAVAARAASSHIGVARRLARDPEVRARRATMVNLPGQIRGVGDAVLAAGRMVEVAQEQAQVATEERNQIERDQLLRTLGAQGNTRLPPTVRSQITELEKAQKRRATRAQRDVLDQSMLDLLSLYRDVLVVQLGADVELVNVEHTDLIEQLAAAGTSTQTLRHMDVIGQTRTRLAGNVAPLLAVEAMMVGLRPQR